MNNQALFSLLSNLSKVVNESGKIDTLDFTKKEDVEKLDNAVKTLKSNEFFANIFGEDLLDTLQEKAHKVYNDAHKEEDKTPTRPQLLVSEKIRRNITNLACEYLNTMILPYSELTEKQVQDILNGLVDFGCWMYNK